MPSEVASAEVATANKTLDSGAAMQDSGSVNGNSNGNGSEDATTQSQDGGVATNNNESAKNNKRKQRRKKKKEKKKKATTTAAATQKAVDDDVEEKVEIEYVGASELTENDPNYAEFQRIFQNFLPPEQLLRSTKKSATSTTTTEGAETTNEPTAPEAATEEKEAGEADEDEEKKPKLSKRNRKLMKRQSVAELKQKVARPDVVEAHDVTAADPLLLIHLKAYRNTVPVPGHWSQKRKYLQGKRTLDKPPFKLPDFIAATGIATIRDAAREKAEEKTMKQKAREKMQPKMGKIDIDYQKLHDAFFKYQTKPKLTTHGDLYYEGKEHEVKLKFKATPGRLSENLKKALGMPPGAPPPWLINMQRYGPPPSYPNLRIPGLNAPIPEGASYGYHPGGWGKPPVDEMGRPLYGDVFGLSKQSKADQNITYEPVQTQRWGELEVEEAVEEEEEEEAAVQEAEGMPAEMGGVAEAEEMAEVEPEIQSGITSVPTGLETPEVIDIRKKKEPEREKKLYTVLETREASAAAGGFMGAAHRYVVPGVGKGGDTGVEVTITPDEMEDLENMDQEALKQRYEKASEAENAVQRQQKAEMAEVFEEEISKRKRKAEKAKTKDKGASDKKYKEFKF